MKARRPGQGAGLVVAVGKPSLAGRRAPPPSPRPVRPINNMITQCEDRAVQPITKRQYEVCFGHLQDWALLSNRKIEEGEGLEATMVEYLDSLLAAGFPSAVAEKAVAAMRHFLPLEPWLRAHGTRARGRSWPPWLRLSSPST